MRGTKDLGKAEKNRILAFLSLSLVTGMILSTIVAQTIRAVSQPDVVEIVKTIEVEVPVEKIVTKEIEVSVEVPTLTKACSEALATAVHLGELGGSTSGSKGKQLRIMEDAQNAISQNDFMKLRDLISDQRGLITATVELYQDIPTIGYKLEGEIEACNKSVSD